MKPLAIFPLLVAAGLGQSPDLQNLPMASHDVILRSTTRMVDVSAIVVDKHGNPVTDLKKEDFQILDEGKRQTVRLFTPPVSGERVSSERQPAPVATPPSLVANTVYSNKAEHAPTHAPTIILIDEHPGKWEEKGLGRDRLIRFLKEQPPGEMIGIYTPTPGGVGVMHEFTQDSGELVNVIQQWGIEPLLHTLKASYYADPSSKAQGLHPCSTEAALQAITASADHVAAIIGRKTLIWFSQGGMPGGGVQNCYEEVKTAQQALNKSNTVLYAVDFRGLQSVQPDASIGSKQLGCNLGCDAGVIAKANTMMESALVGLTQAHTIMQEMADKTGGHAFFDNDVLTGLRTSFSESRSAYALGFYPESPQSDGRFHELEVRVSSRPDVTVRYRRAYVDESNDPKMQLRAALWNPLDANAIGLTAKMDAAGVNLNIAIGDLDLAQASGRWQGKIHVIFAQKDLKGTQFDYRDDTLQIDLKPESYQAMLKTGMAYHQVVQPNPKAALLRVLVRDETGNLGSVTIPLVR